MVCLQIKMLIRYCDDAWAVLQFFFWRYAFWIECERLHVNPSSFGYSPCEFYFCLACFFFGSSKVKFNRQKRQTSLNFLPNLNRSRTRNYAVRRQSISIKSTGKPYDSVKGTGCQERNQISLFWLRSLKWHCKRTDKPAPKKLDKPAPDANEPFIIELFHRFRAKCTRRYWNEWTFFRRNVTWFSRNLNRKQTVLLR